MKHFWNTTFLLVISTVSVLSQPIIITDTVIQTSFCAGSSVIIPFTVVDSGGSFNFGNIFTAQLSDQLGGFSNPTDIGSLIIPWTTSGFILGTIPINSPLFGLYKVRVVGSSPSIIGIECPNYVVIVNTATLATITAPDSVICSGDSMTLTATPFFSSHQWAVNSVNLSGATSSTLSVENAGSYTVTVVDTLGCESTSEPFTIVEENCVGIHDLKTAQQLSLFPNPCNGVLNIELKGDALISIRNLLGEYVLPAVSFQGFVSLNLTALNAGLYFAEIESDGIRTTRKFVLE